MLTYNAARDLLDSARDPSRGKPLANNTRLVGRDMYDPADAVNVRLHYTDIVTILPRDRYILRTGGWKTMTTRDRIRRFSPADPLSVGGDEWALRCAATGTGRDPAPTYPAWPGMPDDVFDDEVKRAAVYAAHDAQVKAYREDLREWEAQHPLGLMFEGIRVNRDGLIVRADARRAVRMLAAHREAMREAKREQDRERRRLRKIESAWRVPVGGYVAAVKATNAGGDPGHGTIYRPGFVCAFDWAPSRSCGRGLHFSRTPMDARQYCGRAERYMLCALPPADVVDLDGKVKAPWCVVFRDLTADEVQALNLGETTARDLLAADLA